MMWERRIPVSFQLFLGVNSPITGPILEGPRAQNKLLESRISATPKFAGIRRRRELPFRPYHSRAHLQDDARAGNSLKLYCYHTTIIA